MNALTKSMAEAMYVRPLPASTPNDWRFNLGPLFDTFDKTAFVRIQIGRKKIEVTTSIAVLSQLDDRNTKAADLHRLYTSEVDSYFGNPQQLFHTKVAHLMDGPRTYERVQSWRREHLTAPVVARVKKIEQVCKKLGLVVRAVHVSNPEYWDENSGGALAVTPFDILRQHTFKITVKIERTDRVPDVLHEHVLKLEDGRRKKIASRIDNLLIDLDGLAQNIVTDGDVSIGEQLRLLNVKIERFKSDVNKL